MEIRHCLPDSPCDGLVRCDVIYITVELPFIRRMMFHDDYVEEKDREWDIRDPSDVITSRNADRGKVNLDAKNVLF